VPREVVKVCMNALAIGGMMEAELITAEVVRDSIE